MADGLDIVPVGVEHKRAKIVWMVHFAYPWGAVVAPIGSERGLIERFDRAAAIGCKRNMNRRADGALA